MSFFITVSMSILVACGGGVTGDDKNFFIVKDQVVTHLGEVVIESGVFDQNALIIIYESHSVLENTKSDTVVGYIPVSAGQYENIRIKLDRKTRHNETLYAELRADNGVLEELELNGVDTVISQSSVSAVSFGIIHAAAHLEVVEEELGQYFAPNAERIDLKEVIADGSSWAVVHRDNEGELGEVMGYQLLVDGYQSKVSIGLMPDKLLSDGSKVIVALYNNAIETEVDNKFDPSMDLLVKLNDESVQLSLDINL